MADNGETVEQFSPHCLHPHPYDPGSFCCCRCKHRSVNLPGYGREATFGGTPCIQRGRTIFSAWRHQTVDWMRGVSMDLFASGSENER
jgi:hypothetical protein